MSEGHSETTVPAAAVRYDGWRGALQRFIESATVRNAIVAVIIANAAVLGLETSDTVMASAGTLLKALDKIALAIFVVEILIKLLVYRPRFFRDPWNLFDFAIIAVSLAPTGDGLSVLRALRILRALRLISAVPRMRLVTQALLEAIPSMGSVVALLTLIFYIAAVMATKLFGEDFDAWFGTVGRSAYSLFQIMTLESWSMGIVRPVMEAFPWAWAFFVPFILITSFTVLNLFIAIIVNAMHEAAAEEEKAQEGQMAEMLEEMRALRAEMAALKRRGR